MSYVLAYNDRMELEIVRADPAGNITIFVMNAVEDRELRAEAVRALMADPELKAEQVGFVTPPARPGDLWELQMMGGEFCGNASRSFGLLAARHDGLSDSITLTIKTSGVKLPLQVFVDTKASYAEIEIPTPLSEEIIEEEGRHFPLYIFEGIGHVIAEDIVADERLVRCLEKSVEYGQAEDGKSTNPLAGQLQAFGVMFYDTQKRFLRPVVCVRDAGTLVFESSCASGTAALALWMARDLHDAGEKFEIAQPGGTITAHVEKRGGLVRRLSIGGKVTLGGLMRFVF